MLRMVTVVQLQPSSQAEIIYPESDGKSMADNTKQFRWIVTIKESLEWLFVDDPTVFIAGDLLWYPIEGDNKTSQAPDAMVLRFLLTLKLPNEQSKPKNGRLDLQNSYWP
jgi:hypothetical protein